MSDRKRAQAPSLRDEIEAGITMFSRILAKLDAPEREKLAAMVARGPREELARFLEQEAIRGAAAIPPEALDEYRRLTTAPDAMGFAARPLLDGEWTALEPQALLALHEASDALGQFAGDMPVFKQGRARRLASLPQSLLYEIEVDVRDDVKADVKGDARSNVRDDVEATPGLVYFIHGPDYLGLAKGGSDVLFRLHERAGDPALDTPERVLDYLELFCSLVRGAEGRFRIVRFDAPDWAAMAAKHDLPPGFGHPSITSAGERSWQVHAIVHYADMLFETDFRISRDGAVEMMDDVPVAPFAPIESWRETVRFAATQAPPAADPQGTPAADGAEETSAQDHGAKE